MVAPPWSARKKPAPIGHRLSRENGSRLVSPLADGHPVVMPPERVAHLMAAVMMLFPPPGAGAVAAVHLHGHAGRVIGRSLSRRSSAQRKAGHRQRQGAGRQKLHHLDVSSVVFRLAG